MKIINIDAPKEFVEKIWDVRIPLPNSIKILLEEFEGDYYDNFEVLQNIIKPHTSHSSVWKFECGMYENIAVLWHTIPIYLRDKRPEIGLDNNCKSIIDPLGAYFPNQYGDTPYIELYLTDIYETILTDIDRDYPTLHFTLREDKEPGYFKNLVTVVLLHELAHAALDIFNLVDAPSSELVSYDTDFGKWREESMANSVALRIIRDMPNTDRNGKHYKNKKGGENTRTKKLYTYAKKFMELQPAEYALGVKMVDFNSSDFDSVFNAKIHGVDPMLQQQWLNYAQGKTGTPPDSAGLKAWNAKINSTFLS